jgi:hypothetical protein
MKTRYGQIEIANTELFSQHPNGFGISPYLQEKLVFLGQLEVYDQAAQLVQKLLGLSVATSQIYRLTNHYGAAIEADLDQPTTLPKSSETVVYAQADGAMLLTDQGYKENKLARLFGASSLQESPVLDRGGRIESSLFVAHLGGAANFRAKFRAQADGYKSLGRDFIFISDGAIWLRQLMSVDYPDATLILDFYHAMSHVGSAAMEAFGTSKRAIFWLEQQRSALLDSDLDSVLVSIRSLSISQKLCDSVCSYMEANRDRMDYAAYRQRGLLIGSGAIESAHRTVVQKRLRRSGQRWGLVGAQQVLNLRVCFMSDRWELVRQKIEPFNYAMAA